MYRLKHLTDRTKHWKAIVVTLAAMVVFVTTYLLILPAVTLDEETAEAQGGIDVNVEETVSDDSVPAQAPDDTDAVKDADNAKADDVKSNDADADDSDAGDSDAEVKPDKAKAAKATSISDGGKTYDVNVTCGEEAGVPEDAMLEVSEISQKTDEYKELFSKTEEALGEDTPVSFVRFFDIKIVDGNGDKVEIAAPVDVKIELTDKDGNKEYGKNTQVVHFPDNTKKGEVIEDVDVKGATVSFPAEGFSEYAIIDTTIEKTVLASDGHNYHIKVTCDPDSGIPANADLAVKEILSDSDQYQDYAAKAESAVGLEEGSAEYIRLFDIKIVDKDDPSVQYQPAKGSTVDVRIELEDSESEDLSVVHFSDKKAKGDVVDAAVDGKTVKFAASGFSVYAVVEGSTDDNARMELEFYSGEELVGTMYVKNGDTLDELQDIIYDPGAGTLNEGELFNGWILDNKNYTSADIGSAMDIEQVREWAEGEPIDEGETHRLDAAICKVYHITYKDLDGTTVLGKGAVPVKASEYLTAAVPATVKMAYTPKDDTHNFEGWKLDEGCDSKVTSTIPANRIYENDSSITIKGDISFTVNAPEGRWLIFDENGRGGKYNAPQFVKSGEVTRKPCQDSDMVRNGYSFAGWYDTKEHADAHGTTGKFTFGLPLDEKKTVFAGWIPNTTAPYTVILWGQKLNNAGTGVINDYEVLGSYANDNGTVGQDIPYTVVENQDEDYVTGVGDKNGHYTGYCLTADSKNQHITITPEGDAVLNLYYDRIQYHYKFYLYRTGSQNNRYDYANNSGPGSDYFVNNNNGLVTWHNNQTEHPGVTGRTILSETVNGRTYYYFVMDAYYGENISTKWPTYDELTGANNHEAVSFVMMVGTKLKPNATNQGSGTVKGIITVMNENILGATNDSNGNYIVVRYPDSFYNWRYHIWMETVDSEDYTGKETHNYNGKTYYEETVLTVRSSNTTVTNQNPPKYEGFEWKEFRGQNWNNSNYWTTGNRPTLYHINDVYDRLTFTISYFDGNYVDGSGNQIQNRATHLIHESEDIPQGKIIEDKYKNYEPEPVAGFVFAGWYIDEACTVPYTWGSMPIGGIVVYAKWVQKQYRIFLHPNAGTDQNLDWGSTNVSTSFRVNYGGKVSAPTGTREGSGYEFVGWYTDPSMTSEYLFNAENTILNESTVKTPYDNTKPTELDKWGNPYVNDEGQYVDEEGVVLTPTANKDNNGNRFWITEELNLYAKWRKVLEGSEGIKVEYIAVDGDGHVGTNPPTDETLYPDQSDAIAQAASKAPEGYYFKCWVLQKWDGNQYVDVSPETTVLPGQQFRVDETLAKKEADPNHSGQYIYTMRLRAEYAEPESELPTHIWWFNNYSESGAERHASIHQDEDIQVNEAVSIQEAPSRTGYKFLGWARVPTTVSDSQDGNPPTGKVLDNLDADDVYLKYEDGVFKLNDLNSQYDGWEVNQVAADERKAYHDMYAVWEPIEYEVTVKKVVIGTTGDKTKEFAFTPMIDTTEGTVFKLKDGQTSDAFKVKYQQLFKVTEASEPDFDVSIVAKKTTDADGTAITPVQINPDSNGKYKIEGDVEITVTNARKSAKLKLYKYDSTTQGTTSEIKLAAGFALYKDSDVENNQPKSGASPVATFTTNASTGYSGVSDQLVSGTYYLFETQAPDGYDSLEYPWVVTIDPSGQHTNIVTVTENGTALPNAVVGPDNDVYTIKVPNNPGVELPESGGPGTTWIYLLGAILLLGSGIALVSRRRAGKAE